MSFEGVLTPIGTGVFSSFAASGLFLGCLSRLRPNVEISKQIAVDEVDGRRHYHVKVVNRTRASLVHVRAEMHFIRQKGVPGGSIVRVHRIPLLRDDAFEIGAFDKNDIDYEFAYRFQEVEEDLMDEWNDELRAIRFRIMASHSISGFTRVFAQEYRNKRTDLVHGDFEAGSSMAVR
jgi:hypothetical protein